MLEPFDVAERIVAALSPLAAAETALVAADGLVLATDAVSPISLPPWANSAMDGYACRANDLVGATPDTPITLRVIESVRAGAFPTRTVGAGEATRIATGAPVPEGADTVIRVEDTDPGTATISIRDVRDAGRNVRAAGEDVRAGDVAVAAGTALGPAQIAVLASVGAATVRVHRRPRVAIVSTGDELVPLEAFDDVRAGRRIVSSNSYGLAAAVRAAGGEPVDGGIVPDDPALIRAALERARTCDLVITSAGVSVGEADHLKRVVSEMGGGVDFWRVRMRPGAPLVFGHIGGTPWLGLPGNPVSCLVTFELFARPAILRLAGHRDVHARRETVVAAEAVDLSAPLTHFLRVQLTHDGTGVPHARLAGPQGSNVLSSLARADALMIVGPEQQPVRIGDRLEAIILAEPTRGREDGRARARGGHPSSRSP